MWQHRQRLQELVEHGIHFHEEHRGKIVEQGWEMVQAIDRWHHSHLFFEE